MWYSRFWNILIIYVLNILKMFKQFSLDIHGNGACTNESLKLFLLQYTSKLFLCLLYPWLTCCLVKTVLPCLVWSSACGEQTDGIQMLGHYWCFQQNLRWLGQSHEQSRNAPALHRAWTLPPHHEYFHWDVILYKTWQFCISQICLPLTELAEGSTNRRCIQ